MKITVKKTGKQWDKLLKGIRDLNNEDVEVGHFESQGTHPESDLKYTELMAIHHAPELHGEDFPARPILDILVFKNQKLDSPEIKSILNKYSRMEPNELSNAWLLEELGKVLGEKEKEIFGSNDLAPNAPSTIKQKGRNDPMVDTGALRNKVAYKTSKNKTVKEV